MPNQSSPKEANESSSKGPSRRRRGERACEFCRIRKLRCDQQRPQCRNCKSRSIACEYAVRPHKARPSNATIDRLTKENAALRAQLLAQSQQQQHKALEQIHHALPSATDLSDHQSSCQATSRGLSTSTPQSTHCQDGRNDAERTGFLTDDSSALADSTLTTTLQEDQRESSAVSLERYQIAQLMAETAKSRHLEKLHLRQGTFNFTRVAPPRIRGLLDLFWSRQHATGSIIYRTAFMRDMAADPPGPYFSPLLLQAMLVFALRCSPQTTDGGLEDTLQKSYGSASSFRMEFERLLWEDNGRVMLQSRVTTIQALLLMSDVLFAWLDERAIAWHYLSVAVSMIIDLGVHVEQQDSKEESLAALERVEDKKANRVVLDKMQSIYQGHPPRLRHADCTIPIHFLDEFEESEPFRTDGFSSSGESETPTYGNSNLKCLCSLSVIADGILSEMYSANSGRSNYEHSSIVARDSLQGQLNQWLEVLPTQFKVGTDVEGKLRMQDGDEPLPHVLSLLSLYHALTILLHRPFVTDAHSLEPHLTSASSLQICHRAAVSISALLQYYESHFCTTAPPYFLTYASYASATIHVRVAAQQQESIVPYEPLLSCLETLSAQGKRNRATARMARVLLSLTDRLGVEVGGIITEDGLWERKEGSSTTVDTANGLARPHGENDLVGWSSMLDFLFDVDPLVGFQGLDPDLESPLDESQATKTNRYW